MIGDDPERKRLVQIVPDAGSATLLVRGPDGARAEIRTVLKEIDRAPSVEFPVRSIALARADAAAVATAIQRFYDDRAKLGQGPRQRAAARKVAVIGDPRSATLLVAASDPDFAEIQSLVQRFDSADATQSLDFRVYPLEHARAEEIAGTVQALLGQIFWTESMRGLGRGGNREDRSSVAIRPDERLNALVVTGRGESFALVEQLIGELDAPPKEGQRRTVRTYRPAGGDPATVAELLKDALGGAVRPGDEGTRARITSVPRSGLLIVSATERQQDGIRRLEEYWEEPVTLTSPIFCRTRVDHPSNATGTGLLTSSPALAHTADAAEPGGKRSHSVSSVRPSDARSASICVGESRAAWLSGSPAIGRPQPFTV